MPYFHIATGMRGAYMPDNAYTIKADTRKELKSYVESEFSELKNAGYNISKKELTATVADIWRNLRAAKRSPYSFVVPYGSSPGSKPYAISIGHATRAEYLEYIEENS